MRAAAAAECRCDHATQSAARFSVGSLPHTTRIWTFKKTTRQTPLHVLAAGLPDSLYDDSEIRAARDKRKVDALLKELLRDKH